MFYIFWFTAALKSTLAIPHFLLNLSGSINQSAMSQVITPVIVVQPLQDEAGLLTLVP